MKTMSDSRDEFENQFPVPEGVFWDIEFARYSCDEGEFGPDADEYQKMWQVWHAARAQSNKWIKCSERLPTEEDQYVWLYFKGHGPYGVSEVLWRWDDDIGVHGETHWKPTGLKRPQPPQEGE